MQQRCPWCGKPIEKDKKGTMYRFTYQCKHCKEYFYFPLFNIKALIGFGLIFIAAFFNVIIPGSFYVVFVLGIFAVFYSFFTIPYQRCRISVPYQERTELKVSMPVMKVKIDWDVHKSIIKGEIYPLNANFDELSCYECLSPIMIRGKNRDGTYNISFLYDHPQNTMIKEQPIRIYRKAEMIGTAIIIK